MPLSLFPFVFALAVSHLPLSSSEYFPVLNLPGRSMHRRRNEMTSITNEVFLVSLFFFNRQVRHVGRRSFLIRSKLEELPRRTRHVLRTSASSSCVTAGSGDRKWSVHWWKRLHGCCSDLSAKRSTTARERIPTEEQSVSKCLSISSKYDLLAVFPPSVCLTKRSDFSRTMGHATDRKDQSRRTNGEICSNDDSGADRLFGLRRYPEHR